MGVPPHVVGHPLAVATCFLPCRPVCSCRHSRRCEPYSHSADRPAQDAAADSGLPAGADDKGGRAQDGSGRCAGSQPGVEAACLCSALLHVEEACWLPMQALSFFSIQP